MKLKKDEIRIYYQSDTGCMVDVEDFIRSFMRLVGYGFYASGMEMETGTRDLCFVKKGVEDGKTGQATNSQRQKTKI